MSKLLRVGFGQIYPKYKEIEKNFMKIRKIIIKHRFDLIVFPELALSGYDFTEKKELHKVSINIENDYFKEIKKICIKEHKAIVMGFAEIEKNKIYNSSILINEKGKHFIYRKTHLFYNEKKVFNKGNTGFFTAQVKGMRVGQMICFDWFFPESARTLSLLGADIIAHPSNLVMPYCQNAMKIRTLENKIFAITANRIGTEGDYTFTGNSQITSYSGEVLAKGYKTRECVKFVDIDYKKSRNKRLNRINDIIRDRRKEYYV